MAVLDKDSETFVADVAKATGIDPRVLTAWVDIEGANAPGGTGHYNYLNLRPTSGDQYAGVSSGNFEEFASVQQAEAATERRLGMPFASGIIAAAHAKASPRVEINAIAGSGWDAGHYGGAGGPNLVNEFESIFGKGSADSKYEAITGFSGAAATATAAGQGGSTIDKVKDAATGIPGAIEDAAGEVKSVFDFLFSYRFLEIVGGGALVLVGLVGLMREVGITPPSLPGGATEAAEAAATVAE